MAKSLNNSMLERLPLYLNFLKSLAKDAPKHISATTIAKELNMGDVNVRKDLAAVSGSGKPKVGYVVSELIDEIETNLGYRENRTTVILGAGRLGRALMDYGGFKEYGLDIVAAFDVDEKCIGTTESGKHIYHTDYLKEFCLNNEVQIGIITVPASKAQEVCKYMVECGITAIWNFAPTHLNVPHGVLVLNENMAASLARFSTYLKWK